MTNSDVEFLLKLLMFFCKVFLQKEWCETKKEIFSDIFSCTSYSFWKIISFDQICFIRHGVCLKFSSLHHIDEFLVWNGAEIKSKLYIFVKYQNHTKTHFRQRYGQVLTEEVKSVSGKKMFYPVQNAGYHWEPYFCKQNLK